MAPRKIGEIIAERIETDGTDIEKLRLPVQALLTFI